MSVRSVYHPTDNLGGTIPSIRDGLVRALEENGFLCHFGPTDGDGGAEGDRRGAHQTSRSVPLLRPWRMNKQSLFSNAPTSCADVYCLIHYPFGSPEIWLREREVRRLIPYVKFRWRKLLIN
jgi:hypothetical protein